METNKGTELKSEVETDALISPQEGSDEIILDGSPVNYEVEVPMDTDDELIEEAHSKENPPFKGTYVPVTNVTLVTEILDKLDKVSDGAVVFSNHNLADLIKMRDSIWMQVSELQQQRRALPKAELDNNYLIIDGYNFIITQQESTALEVINNSMDNLLQSPQVQSMEEGQWTNLPTHGDKPCAITLLGNHKDPVRRIQSRLGIRNEASSFLVHSGLHVEFESSSALDTSLLLDKIVEERSDASRESLGYSLETTDVHQNSAIMNFAYDSLINTNLGEISKDAFEEMVSVFDLDNIKIALASTIYRDGFEIFRSCISDKLGDKEPCGHRDSYLIHSRRTRIIKWDRLSDHQKVRATRKEERVDIKTINEYKANLNPTVTKFVPIGDGLFVKLRDPSYADYKRISTQWVDLVVNASKSLPSMDDRGNNPRTAYVARANERAKIMRLAHFVEGIYSKEAGDEDYTMLVTRVTNKEISSRDDILTQDSKVDEILMDLPNNGESHLLAVEGIEKFIKEYNLTLFVLAKTACSKCGSPHPAHGEVVGPDLLVINPGEVFFTLLLLKTGAVQ